MPRTTFLAAALLVCAAACGPATTEPVRVDTVGAAHDGNPPPDTTTIQSDTTRRGGGTIGSGT
ncbi:MAG TPA: hypothetical protein VFT45_12995 [Longimicrobium sp.]|nr:hypothetical protein [Longimicrobium sp.]